MTECFADIFILKTNMTKKRVPKMTKSKSRIKNIYSEKKGEHFLKEKEEWAVKIGRLFGIPLARAIKALPVKIHPNIISVISLIFALFAAYYFFNNKLVFGAIFFFLSYVFDCSDGILARLTDTQSKFGEKLDFYIDITGNVFMYFGLWYSQYYLYGQWFLGGSIIAEHYTVMAFGYLFIKDRTYKTFSPKLNSYYSAADEGILTFLFAPITGYFTLILPILIILQLASYIILFSKQKERPDIRKNIRSMFKI